MSAMNYAKRVMSARTRKRNIKLVLAALRRMSPGQCRMDVYVQPGAGRVPETRRGTGKCGTTACLAGWGALLCAPTVDTAVRVKDFWDESYDWYRSAAEMESVIAVPKTWARRYGIRPADPEKYTFSGSSRLKKTHVFVKIHAVGHAVLGDEAENLFLLSPSFGSDHQAWMIEKLERILAKMR